MVRATCYDSNGDLIEKLYQWDQNRYVKVEGLTITDGASVFFNFSNRRNRNALVIEATAVEGGYTCVIPNDLLRQPDTIYMYVVEKFGDADERRTVEDIRIPLIPREQPDDYIYNPTPTIKIATGLVLEDGKIFLADGGKKFGTGIPVEGTNVAGSTVHYMYGTVVGVFGETEEEDET